MDSKLSLNDFYTFNNKATFAKTSQSIFMYVKIKQVSKMFYFIGLIELRSHLVDIFP